MQSGSRYSDYLPASGRAMRHKSGAKPAMAAQTWLAGRVASPLLEQTCPVPLGSVTELPHSGAVTVLLATNAAITDRTINVNDGWYMTRPRSDPSSCVGHRQNQFRELPADRINLASRSGEPTRARCLWRSRSESEGAFRPARVIRQRPETEATSQRSESAEWSPLWR